MDIRQCSARRKSQFLRKAAGWAGLTTDPSLFTLHPASHKRFYTFCKRFLLHAKTLSGAVNCWSVISNGWDASGSYQVNSVKEWRGRLRSPCVRYLSQYPIIWPPESNSVQLLHNYTWSKTFEYEKAYKPTDVETLHPIELTIVSLKLPPSLQISALASHISGLDLKLSLPVAATFWKRFRVTFCGLLPRKYR